MNRKRLLRTASVSSFFASMAAILVAADALGDTIELRRAVRMPEGRTELTLRDIAAMEGEHALSLAETVVFTVTSPLATTVEIPVEDIQAKLEAAGVRWASVHLAGGDVTVRPRARAATATPQAMHSISIEKRTVPEVPREYRENVFLAVGIVRENTLRGAIAQRFVHALGVDAADLRLTFDAEDEAFLLESLAERRFEIQPRTNFASERVELTVREWAGSEVAQTRTVTVQPLVRALTTTMAQSVSRGQMITEHDIARDEQWLAPNAAAIHAAPEQAIGMVASITLREGVAVRSRDVTTQAVVERGDRVVVRCVSGSVVITMTAEAREDGSVGQEIELRKVGERDSFTATVTGPGEVVVHLNG